MISLGYEEEEGLVMQHTMPVKDIKRVDYHGVDVVISAFKDNSGLSLKAQAHQAAIKLLPSIPSASLECPCQHAPTLETQLHGPAQRL
jgi:hypothetical protein